MLMSFDDVVASGDTPREPGLDDTDESGNYLHPRTFDELVLARARSVESYAQLSGGGMLREFTCDSCRFVSKCQFAFDQYNTLGDCLQEK